MGYHLLPQGTFLILPANGGDVRDLGSVPGAGRSLQEEMATHSSILVWRIPWTEGPGGLQSMGRKELDTTGRLWVTHFLEINLFYSMVINLNLKSFLCGES